MKSLIHRLFVIILVLSGCTGKPDDPRLLEIAEKVSDSPKDMLEHLDSMDVSSMKESDRYYHALLSVKAKDKAYIQHTSDSVILKVIDYYYGHKGSGLYPEALYYGGRVYSDIGDAPTALRYFQEALDEMPENADKIFHGTVLSQTGRLLNSLRLYSEAVKYLKEAIKYQSEDFDSIKVMQNTQLLGAIYMHSKDYDSAESCFSRAREMARGIMPKDTVIQNMYLAAINFYRGNVKDALNEIREVEKTSPESGINMVHAYASQIYLEAGITDTAYLYALNLVKSRYPDYRKNGYSILLSPDLRGFTTADSLVSYLIEYRDLLEEYLDKHDGEQIAMQTSLYNYQTHELERVKSEQSKRTYMSIAGVSVFLIMVLCMILMYVRNRRMRTLLLYRRALDDIVLLKTTLASEYHAQSEIRAESQEVDTENAVVLIPGETETVRSDEEENMKEAWEEEEDTSDVKSEKEELRDRLKDELLSLQRLGKAKKGDAKDILGPILYEKLIGYVKANNCIPEVDIIWNELDQIVNGLSPDFKERLYLLTGNRLKEDAYRMAMLIRCGFKPTEIAKLLGRTKGALSSRRGYICEMIFGEKLGASVMDDVIRLL